MKTFIQHGELLTVTAPAAVSSGDGVLLGNLFGIAVADAASGASVALATEGVYLLPKLSTAVLAQGARVSWDSTAGECVVPATGKYVVGIATEAAGNGATSIKVRLDGISTVAAA
jgi:predicted RecA/RadA family phage recombinase